MNLLKYFNMCCKAYAVMFCFVETYLLLFPMFMLAWSSGTMKCLMDINKYGEGFIEIVFWLVSFPFVAYGMLCVLKDIFGRVK